MAELRFVDLSVPIQNPIEGELGGGLSTKLAADITYSDHKDMVPAATEIFGCEPSDLPDEQAWAQEELRLSSHAGTHLDAPWHYFPTCEGKPAKTIDEVPLEACFGDGVVLDLSNHGSGKRVDLGALEEAVAATGSPLGRGEIVLVRFDSDKAFGTSEYWTDYPGLTGDATRWIVDQGVRVIGTDAVGFDRDFDSMSAEFRENGDPSRLWEAHRAGITHEYFQIEKLANLDQLPARGFKVACFPVKIAGASAGWIRAVAIFGL